MEAEKYDFISLGSGEAGKYIAWNLSAKLGMKCAAIEEEYIGGSCPNTACLPSKNFLHSAAVAHDLRQAASFGLGAFVADSGHVQSEMTAVKARKVAMVDGLVDLHLENFRNSKAELIMGHGTFVGPKTIKLDNGRLLTAEHIAICTGSKAKIDGSIPGLVEAKPLTHISILNIQKLPPHLIILGGGYVGLEFAQAFCRFGSQVTVIEHHDQVLRDEDKDVVDVLANIMAREGVKFRTGTKVLHVSGTCGSSVTLEVQSSDTESIQGTHILVAAGRVPRTANIGLEEAGIALTRSGHVQVDEQLRTSVPGVFAVGDCAGSPHFTHVAYDDFRVVFAQIAGAPRAGGTTGRQIPSTLFTSPELAHVGLREHEARARGIPYRLAKWPMGGFLRSRTLGPAETEGFAKALIEVDGDKILGFTALGPSTGELLPAVQLAMKLGAGYQEIANLVITHPTMGEGLVGLFSAVPPRK